MKNVFKYTLVVCLALIGFASCQESDDTPEEFPDWQEKNDAAFLQIYSEAKEAIARGEDWKIIRGTYRADKTEDGTESPTDYIVVEVLEEGYGWVTPYATDSVLIHYEGKLIPSTSSKTGMTFDSSFYLKYEEGVSSPLQGCVGSFIEGFSTALQYMNRGDYWKVYIPYQLGYKSSSTTSIPAYSMLIFYLRLEDFWTKIEGDRSELFYLDNE
jgi:FKBP-type peptidyl-prolyl cis-trans isomerase FklB